VRIPNALSSSSSKPIEQNTPENCPGKRQKRVNPPAKGKNRTKLDVFYGQKRQNENEIRTVAYVPGKNEAKCGIEPVEHF